MKQTADSLGNSTMGQTLHENKNIRMCKIMPLCSCTFFIYGSQLTEAQAKVQNVKCNALWHCKVKELNLIIQSIITNNEIIL